LGHLTRKTVPEMTYNVFSGTLNPTHSLTHSLSLVLLMSSLFLWHLGSTIPVQHCAELYSVECVIIMVTHNCF